MHLQKIANKILQSLKIKKEDASFEVTEENSIFCNLRCNEEITIHIEVYMSAGSNCNSFFSIWTGDDMVVNGCGSLENVLSDITLYLTA